MRLFPGFSLRPWSPAAPLVAGGMVVSTLAAAGADGAGSDAGEGSPGTLWSLEPLEAPAVPGGGGRGAGAGAIDRFVDARLAESGLVAAPEAAPRDLVRRLSYDLRGLPPEAEVIEAFAADPSDEAWARLVDGWLASPAFGEAWGRHWLDLARYADSNGGDINFTWHHAWRYRNYVIDAFNGDKRFDDFIREQLAGDLMPSSRREERSENLVASGFLMIGPKMTSERDKEKMVLDIADEQLDTVGRVFLGMTFGCARCHEHKFDPVSMRDYYAMAGIFTSTLTATGIRMGNPVVSGWSEVELPVPDEQARDLAAARERLAAVAGVLKAAKARLDKLGKGRPVEPADFGGVVVDDADAETVGEWKPSTHSPDHLGAGYRHDDKTGKGEKAVVFRAILPDPGEYEVRLAYNAGASRASNAPVTVAHAEGTSVVELDQTVAPGIAGLFQPVGRWRFDAGEAVVTLGTGGTVDRFVIADAVQLIGVDEIAAEQERLGKRARGELEDARLAEAEAEVEKLGKEKAAIETLVAAAPVAMVPRDRDAVADCAVRLRGEPSQKGEVVARGLWTMLPGGGPAEIPEGQSGRLELADWLASTENPLTWRVIANRVWHHLFGSGLVRTVDNFGALGEKPSHPALLDHLAARFRDGDQSVKALVREIVRSRAYRRSTRFDEAAWQADPDNRLLWRQNRRRLTAEAIRDSLLASSGELDPARPEGSPVAGFGESAIGSDGKRSSDLDVASLKCRSVYLPMIRADRLPVLSTFDFAEMEMVVGRRAVTTVPEQALFFMNSPFVGQRSEEVARLAREAGGDPEGEGDGALREVFRRVLARPPRDGDELARARDLAAAEGLETLARALYGSTEFRLLD